MVKRAKEKEFGARDVTPMPWKQVSGDQEQDALYVLRLATRDLRLREMRRLKHHHGQDYADQVGDRVKEMWPHRDEIISGKMQAANDQHNETERAA